MDAIHLASRFFMAMLQRVFVCAGFLHDVWHAFCLHKLENISSVSIASTQIKKCEDQMAWSSISRGQNLFFGWIGKYELLVYFWPIGQVTTSGPMCPSNSWSVINFFCNITLYTVKKSYSYLHFFASLDISYFECKGQVMLPFWDCCWYPFQFLFVLAYFGCSKSSHLWWVRWFVYWFISSSPCNQLNSKS